MTPRSQISRRSFLASSSSAVAVLSHAPSAIAASLNNTYDETIVDGIIRAIAGPVELSEILIAALKRDFENQFDASALSGIATHFRHNGIRNVLETQANSTIENQIQWIALYLFTGSSNPSDDKAPLTNYPHALGWKSLRFAKAPGLCAGPEFGYWLKPWSTT